MYACVHLVIYVDVSGAINQVTETQTEGLSYIYIWVYMCVGLCKPLKVKGFKSTYTT
jgi:hypothetical protein